MVAWECARLLAQVRVIVVARPRSMPAAEPGCFIRSSFARVPSLQTHILVPSRRRDANELGLRVAAPCCELSVESKLEGVVKHAREEHFQKLRAFLNAGIRVALDQPHRQVCIHHKVEAKNFKAPLAPLWVKLCSDTFKSLIDKELHIVHQIPLDTESVLLFEVLIDVSLQILKWELVAILVPSICCVVLLHSIVRQVYEGVVAVVDFVLGTRCAEVSFSIERVTKMKLT